MHTFTLTLLASIGAIVIYMIASYFLAMVINKGEFELLNFDDDNAFFCLSAAQAVIAVIAISLYFCTKYM